MGAHVGRGFVYGFACWLGLGLGLDSAVASSAAAANGGPGDLNVPQNRFFVVGVIAGGTEDKPIGIVVLEDKVTGKSVSVEVNSSLPGMPNYHVGQVERRAVTVVKTSQPEVSYTLSDAKSEYQVAETFDGENGVDEAPTFLQRFYKSFGDGGQDPFVQSRPFRFNRLNTLSEGVPGTLDEGEDRLLAEPLEPLLDALRVESAEKIRRYRIDMDESTTDDTDQSVDTSDDNSGYESEVAAEEMVDEDESQESEDDNTEFPY